MSHSPSPKQSAELRELIQSLHDQRITPEERVRLEEWLYRDKEARRIYVQYMYLYARLRWDRRRAPEPDQASPDGKTQVFRTPILGFLGDAFQAGADFLSRGLVISLLLAVGLPGILLLILIAHIGRQPVEPSPTPVVVAEIAKTQRCVWSKGNAEMSVGTRLLAGHELRLKEGLAEIAFADGATAILQGPTTFQIRGANAGFLDVGTITATVPPSVRGFTIQTPLASVVDLGTAFGVSVGDDGTSEAHVFTGRVEVAGRATADERVSLRRKLRVGQAVRIRLVGTGKTIQAEMIASTPSRFVRRIAPPTNAGLPEPKILFAHRGGRDPTTEGWITSSLMRTKIEDYGLAPINDQGTEAWAIRDGSMKGGLHYRIGPREKLSPKLVAEAKTKGWVMRARIKMVDQKPLGMDLCHFTYRDDSRMWRLRPSLNADRSQVLVLRGNSSLGENAKVQIPDSRDRYVDYEVRYQPATSDADVYVNGRLVATGFYIDACDAPRERTLTNRLRFGTGVPQEAEMRIALFEWGIVGEAPETPKVPEAPERSP